MVYTWIGLILTGIGVALGIWALVETRREHSSRPLFGWWPTFKVWFRITVLRQRHDATFATVGVAVVGAGGVSAQAFSIPPPDAAVERQITYLREQVEWLRVSLRKESQERSRAVSSAYDKLHAADQAMAAKVQRLDERTEGIAAGSTWKQIWGLVLVGIGSALMAVPSILGGS